MTQLAIIILFALSQVFQQGLCAEQNRHGEGELWTVVHRAKDGSLYMQRIAFPNDGRGLAEVWEKEIESDLEYKVQYDCESNYYRYLQYNPRDATVYWGDWEKLPNDLKSLKLLNHACLREPTK